MHRKRYLHAILSLLFFCLIPTTRHAAAIGGNTWSYYLLTTDNKIGLGIESQPNLPVTPAAVIGLTSGDTLVAIAVRPQNGRLYGLATTATPGAVQLYAIDLNSGSPFATLIGTAGSFTAITDLGANFGMDFNPVVDRLRVVSDNGSNFRINPNTGALIDSDSIPANGTNPDAAINGATTSADATAYTNAAPNTSATTQYTLDSASNSLYIQSPPNNGTQTNPLPITLNSVPLDFSNEGGFDIPHGVNVSTSNSPATGQALAALSVAGVASLYSIELSTGAATLIGALNGLSVRDIAVFPTTPAAIALDTSGPRLKRFALNTPGTITNQQITNISVGELLVGIANRPATGQLYGLGANVGANTASLYIIDPQTGAATLVGTSAQIAFVDTGGITAVDFPPINSGYGIDFNPTVDRLRVVAGTGLNFRVNPNNGAPVDGDSNATNGTNPDGAANGLPIGSTGVSAAAYTNNYGQSLVGGITTLYTLDPTSNKLFIQNPANAGTQTSGVALTLGGAPIDFSAAVGFDIPAGVNAPSSGAAATGNGYATLTVNNSTSLYRIQLATGASTLLGSVDAGTLSLNGLVVWNAPNEVAISSPSLNIPEDSGNVTITINRRSGAPVVLSYSIFAGTASASSDYTPTSGVLSFRSGETSKSFVLQITDDKIAEPNKNLTIQLNGPIEGITSQILTIVDDDRDLFLPRVMR